MWKWKWQALAQIARVYVNGGHPIIGGIVITAIALSPAWVSVAVVLAR